MTDKKNTGMAVVAYLIFFLPLLTEAKKDPFVKYHVKQGLGLLISFFVLRFLTLFLIAPLFYLSVSLFMLVLWATNLFMLALLILGMMNASKGEEKPLPLIGKWADKLLKF
ncbi:MAG: hypothetical protein NUV96_02265 [Candidatus Colwellbacteria bacterium]|nr:hypothetical protein [Candidatus Colwellbacteria bacterium]